MPSSDLENLIQSLASKYVLNAAIIKSIVSQESQWNMYAMKREDNYKWLYSPEKFIGPLNSLSTEISLQKHSWGLGQLMGALARELGHAGYMAELIRPETNLELMCLHLDQLCKISSHPQDIFAMYNGGEGAFHKTLGKYKNQSYVDSCMSYLQKFQNS